jgi:hypothetical protein
VTDSQPAELQPGDPDYVPAPRPPRVRRPRSVTESLLSIVLLLEAIVLFFVALVLFGLKTLSPGLAFGGAAAFIVLILIAIGLLRWRVGVVLGWIVQVLLIALGVLNPVMYVVGVGFAAFWTWCFVQALRIDRKRREFETSIQTTSSTTSPTPEGDTL